jgi:GMP synthase-like glutamine amidotransferase
MGAPIKRLTHT